MKKRISGIVALLACVTCFAGCDAWDKVTGLFGDKVTYNVEGAADYLYAIEIEKNEETRSDYTVPNTWTYMGVEYAVEWTVNVTSGVVIKKGETETTVDVDEMLAENLTYVLTAKLTAGDGSTASVTLERIVEAMPSTVAAPITAAPVEGTAYKYYVWQSTKQLDCYFTGKMDGFYFKTTEDFSKAIDVYVEYVTDSTTEFYPWFNHPDDNSKQYIGVKAELGTDGNMHDNLVFAASPVSSFVWDADLATITTTIIDKNGEQTAFYLGNYNTYTTISASAVSKAATSNVGHLVELVSRDVVPATEKVAQSVRTFSLSNYYFGDGTIELPVIDETFPDVAISYTVTNADYANGVLSYTAGTEDKTVTVKATFTCGEVTDEKEISFTVSPIPTGLPEAGTELTIPQILALDLTAFGNGYNNGKTESSYVVKGTVTSIKNAWSDQYNNMDVYVSDDAGNQLLVYRLATQVEVGDIVSVTGSLGTYSGTNQVAAGATAEITGKAEVEDEYTVMTIAEALKAEDETKVCVSGTVTAIDYSWNDKYGNMSITISDGTNTLYLYKLATKVEAYDIITVKGTMSTYNSARQIGEGATAEIIGTYSTLTISEALSLAEEQVVSGTNASAYTTDMYYVEGTVASIASTKYGNMTIEDADGNQIYVYGTYGSDGTIRYDSLESRPVAGDSVKLLSVVGKYVNKSSVATLQLNNAWIISVNVGHTCDYTLAKKDDTNHWNECLCGAKNGVVSHTFEDVVTAPTCVKAGYTTHTCSCGFYYTDTEVAATGIHNATTETPCTGCGGTLDEDGNFVPAPTTVSVTMANLGWANGTQYTSLSLDSDISISVSYTSSYNNTGKYYTNDSTWRIYQNESPAILVKASEGKTIVSVKITYIVANTGILTNGDTQVSSGTVVDVNANSITFGVGNTGTATDGQVKITAIEVIYK